VPCDAPFFPDDLVARLSDAFSDPRCELATASAPDPEAPGALRSHPVFALMRTSVASGLAASLDAGERRVNAWRARHMAVEVAFDDTHDASAFYNVNTLEALDEAC
jgi:molybdopterin-guanine dinucleotide biosynthesis protein A